MRQQSFLKQLGYTLDRSHGGQATLGKRKVRRPLDPRYPLHLVLRASCAKKNLSLLRPANRDTIYRILTTKAKKFHVNLDGYANVGNHLHLKLRFKKRENFQKFLKSITSLIARHVTGARKGRPFGKFWDHLAFTKVIRVWRQEKQLDRYIVANAVEAYFGPIARTRFLQNTRANSS